MLFSWGLMSIFPTGKKVFESPWGFRDPQQKLVHSTEATPALESRVKRNTLVLAGQHLTVLM